MTDGQESAPVQPGDVLAGKYKVERVLGVGGMGVVVAATHLQLHQLVALKFALPSALQNAGAIERFLREARAAVKLKSEHAAKVLDVGTLESGAPYMVMEYLDGSDLSQVVAQEGALSVESACDFVLQACEALAEAHSLGIIHRDLKPQNLFLTRSVGGAPLVKVLDFGISKMKSSADSAALTRTSAVMGSPLYMAPEQMRSSRNVDPRADIWALGVILYELLTGHVPFEAETMPELCLKVVQDPPRPMSELRNDVPPEVVAIISKCLEKDPNARYQNAAELASALEPFAPEGSRRAADRARLVLSSVSGSMPIPPSLAMARTQPQAVTDAGVVGDAAKPGKSKAPLYIGAAIAAIAIGAVGAFVALGGKSPANAGAPSAATSVATAPASTAPVATAPASTASAAPAMTAAASTATAAPSASEAPSAVASVSAAPSASHAPTATAATTGRTFPIRTGPTAPANTGGGDEIPRTRK